MEVNREETPKPKGAKAILHYDERNKRWTASVDRKGQTTEFRCSDISLLRDFLDAKGIPDE